MYTPIPTLPEYSKITTNLVLDSKKRTFDDRLKKVVKMRVDLVESMEDFKKTIEEKRIDNAAQHYFSFPMIVAETVGRLGVIVAGVNTSMIIFDSAGSIRTCRTKPL